MKLKDIEIVGKGPESRGFFYQKGTNRRLPYWVSENQAARFAATKAGTGESFQMALPSYGIMDPIEWEYRGKDIPANSTRWRDVELKSLR